MFLWVCSAQLLLSKSSLQQLMLMNAADLMLTFPSLPVKVVQVANFFKKKIFLPFFFSIVVRSLMHQKVMILA